MPTHDSSPLLPGFEPPIAQTAARSIASAQPLPAAPLTSEPPTEVKGAQRLPNVQNGTWTVEHPQRGHYTVKLFTVLQGKLAGKRILAILVGSNNETDYQGVAFWDDEQRRVNVWRRFQSPEGTAVIDAYNWDRRWGVIEKKLAIWADLAVRGASHERHGYWFGENYSLLHEGMCVVCNRKLTDPESIRTGVGPTCGGR